jgi:ABC-type phosphate/phosphonate transport system substrate-binding protein
MSHLLQRGALDFAWICTNPYMQYEEDFSPVAVPLYQGKPLYQAYLIVSADERDIRSLADLKGKVFAFSDPDSNTGHLIIQHALLALNARPEQFLGPFSLTATATSFGPWPRGWPMQGPWTATCGRPWPTSSPRPPAARG